MIQRLLLFGATGDVAGRYLAPALLALEEAGRLPEPLRVVGAGRHDWDGERFREHIAEALRRHGGDAPVEARHALLHRLDYRRTDVTDAAAVGDLVRSGDGPLVAYLALPPALFSPTVGALADAGLPAGSRVVVEKPFGEDLASARALNRQLHEHFREDAVFRVDHFLGMQTARNLLALRFANRIFEPLWNAAHVERVDIIWEETVALEGRAGYYDATGALRDVVQNHFLQLLCLLAMEAPATMHEQELRDGKVAVLRAVRRLDPDEVEARTVRGRYTAGRVGDRRIPAYVDEDGVDAQRDTETFAQVRFAIDNWRWRGVPFTIRSGKALARDRREIVVRFRSPPHFAFSDIPPPAPAELRLRLEPDDLELRVTLDQPGDTTHLATVGWRHTPDGAQLPAYGRVLLAALEGDFTLSVRDDEAEESWRVIDPILAAWDKGCAPLRDYPAGSDGPPLGPEV